MMNDRNGKRIQRGDLVRVDGCYFSAMDGTYCVVSVGDVLRLQRLGRSVLNECSMPRADMFTTSAGDIVEVIGSAFCAA